VSHDVARQPCGLVHGGKIGAQAEVAIALIPDAPEGTPRCADSACPRVER
jgi:acyl-coenzyme A thioesterase PaaI-like protein